MPPRELVAGGFSCRLAIAEALANLRASPARAVASAVLGLLAGALTVVATSLDVGRIVAYDDDLIATGTNLFIVQRSDGLGLDAARCDSLRSQPGVVAAGGVASAKRVVSTVDSAVSFDLIQASPGYAAVVWPQLQRQAGDGLAVASARVAERLGIADSGGVPYISAEAADYVEVAVAPGQPRESAQVSSVVVPTAPTGRLSECWVEAASGAREGVEALALGWFDEPVRMLVTPAMLELPLGSSPAEQLAQRFSRWIPLAAALVVTAFQTALYLARRADLGLYGLLGLRGCQLAAMVAADSMFTVMAPVGLGMLMAAAWCASELTGAVLAATAWDCLRLAALLTLVPLVVLVLAKSVKPFDAIRGR
ncbi:MAG: hypothetical protein LBG60_00830 [Bifidobacteriaceae bacterium]|jgi:hypothetical protein|nr:hypothetical protein [Bifidobacteriaceae bacterium]